MNDAAMVKEVITGMVKHALEDAADRIRPMANLQPAGYVLDIFDTVDEAMDGDWTQGLAEHCRAYVDACRGDDLDDQRMITTSN